MTDDEEEGTNMTIDMGDLARVIEPGRMAAWLGTSLQCWRGRHTGCWRNDPNPQGRHACSCHCHPTGELA